MDEERESDEFEDGVCKKLQQTNFPGSYGCTRV